MARLRCGVGAGIGQGARENCEGVAMISLDRGVSTPPPPCDALSELCSCLELPLSASEMPSPVSCGMRGPLKIQFHTEPFVLSVVPLEPSVHQKPKEGNK